MKSYVKVSNVKENGGQHIEHVMFLLDWYVLYFILHYLYKDVKDILFVASGTIFFRKRKNHHKLRIIMVLGNPVSRNISKTSK